MPVIIKMPALSPTMTDGKIVKWMKKVGDTVNIGDVLVEIETDKAVMELEAVDEGVIHQIICDVSDESIAINKPIALLKEDGDSEASLKTFIDNALVNKVKSNHNVANSINITNKLVNKDINLIDKTMSINDKKHDVINSANNINNNRIFISPVAKSIAKQNSIDIGNIVGTGYYGRIIKTDVEHYNGNTVNRQNDTVKTTNIFGDYKAIPHTGIRKVIAKRLTESKQNIPHFYLSVDVIMDELLLLRSKINKKSKVKITINDFIVKACGMALNKFPMVNAIWHNDEMRQMVDVDVAVAVDSSQGLVTPVVRNVDKIPLSDLSIMIKNFVVQANEGKLKHQDMQGGGMTISNLGMYGIKNFQAIINPPQSCILAVGAGAKSAVVSDDKLIIANVMNITLSADHRCLDGGVAAKFLQHLKELLEDPISFIV